MRKARTPSTLDGGIVTFELRTCFEKGSDPLWARRCFTVGFVKRAFLIHEIRSIEGQPPFQNTFYGSVQRMLAWNCAV